jgi:hypothetical protein
VTVRLVLPLPPNAANLRRNWRKVYSEKRAYWDSLNMLEAAGRFDKPAAPIERARISAHLYVWSFMDDDNAMSRMKIAIDWLKGAYIVDDSRKHLQWEGLPEQTIDRKNPRVVLRISEAA